MLFGIGGGMVFYAAYRAWDRLGELLMELNAMLKIIHQDQVQQDLLIRMLGREKK